MTSQDRYIPGVPCWTDCMQPDVDAALTFYGGLFGWKFEDVMPADEPARYSIARRPGGDAGAIGGPPEGPVAWSTYVWVDSADETAAKVWAAGGRVLTEPMDVGDSGRMAVCADREGAVFCLWEARGHRGAAVVNEHGSVNFNTLSTRDPEGAEAFYGAVFGWERLQVGEGSMWALPAYGDFLEQRMPGIRENMKGRGAPERFEEVVAALEVVGADAEPHWGVTFAVDDADAAAARATELGGRVLAGPFDAPWVRMAVICDPAGATFVASQFVPENKELPAPDRTATAA